MASNISGDDVVAEHGLQSDTNTQPAAEALSEDPTEMEMMGEASSTPGQVEVHIRVASRAVDASQPLDVMIRLSAVSLSDTILHLKSSLLEVLETSCLTSYRFALIQLLDSRGESLPIDGDAVLLDHVEIGSFIASASAARCVLELQLESYDLKKVRVHLGRCMDVLLNPPQMTIKALSSLRLGGGCKVDSEVDDGKVNELLPSAAEHSQPMSLDAFYDEVLHRHCVSSRGDVCDSAQHRLVGKKLLTDHVRGFFASGWNPPPSSRKLQGDLLYVEVVLAAATASEGGDRSLHITCTASGFFVNRSSRTHFDPSPAVSHHFHHGLMDTLKSCCASFRSTWQAIAAAADENRDPTGGESHPFNAIVSAYSAGRPPSSAAAHEWVIPRSVHSAAHSYDLFRSQLELSDLHGMEELGASREWNEEIQAIRSLPVQSLEDRVLRAKLEFKTIYEFTAACRTIAVAIADGLISPISFADPTNSGIYLYNGIFLSRAEDTKDSFQICRGDEAYRKSTNREVQNQRLIRSLDVEGLSLTLITSVDFKGQRYVGQSVVPGVFTQGENAARLVYGILEKDKMLTVKHQSLVIMKSICSHLHIPVRNVSLYPFRDAATEEEEESKTHHGEEPAVIDGQQLGLEAPPIKVDELDNVADSSCSSTPHCGPIECKLLKGSDGKVYALEVMRLTPRDANYVVGAAGTSRLDEQSLAGADKDLLVTYVLRRELINLFVQSRVYLRRQQLIEELIAAERERQASIIVDDSSKSSAETTEELYIKVAMMNADKLQSITAQSIVLSINPNCFLSFPPDEDPAVAAEDERTAREIAIYLWDQMLPMVTKQVKERELSPKDNASMVRMLHDRGVNIRYLGRLAALARGEEDIDQQLLRQSKQRVPSMPLFWWEMLVIEMIARAAKHVMNEYYRQSQEVSVAPSRTIASLINHILSVLGDSSSSSSTAAVADAVVSDHSAGTSGIVESKTSKHKKHKKKKSSSSSSNSPARGPGCPSGDELFALPDATVSREACLRLIMADIRTRYCYHLDLLGGDSGEGGEPGSASLLLSRRISKPTLLRRICQACGVCIADKAFDFSSAAVLSPDDVVALVPVTTSCEPEELCGDFEDLLTGSARYAEDGDYPHAYESAQQAFHLTSQITGPFHANTCRALGQISNVLLRVGDYSSALTYASRSLAVAVQTSGFDSDEALSEYTKLASVHTALGQWAIAMRYSMTVRYLLELMTGHHHPDRSSVFSQLASIYDGAGDLDAAVTCYNSALRFSGAAVMDTNRLMIHMANLYFRKGLTQLAIELQKRAYKVLKDLLKDDANEQLLDVKKTLEQYMREGQHSSGSLLEQVALQKAVSLKTCAEEGAAAALSADIVVVSATEAESTSVGSSSSDAAVHIAAAADGESDFVKELIRSFEEDAARLLLQKKKTSTLPHSKKKGKK